MTPPGEAQSVERYLIKVGNREREGQDFARYWPATSAAKARAAAGAGARQPRYRLRLSGGAAGGWATADRPQSAGVAAARRKLPRSRAAHDIQFRDMARINQQFDALRWESACSATISWTPARRTPSRPSGWSYSGNTSCCPNARRLNRDRQRDALLLRDMHGQTLTIPLSQCAMPGTRTP